MLFKHDYNNKCISGSYQKDVKGKGGFPNECIGNQESADFQNYGHYLSHRNSLLSPVLRLYKFRIFHYYLLTFKFFAARMFLI